MKIKLLLVLFVFPLLLSAQTTLTFLDEQSKEPVVGVLVKSSDKNTYLSDEKGVINIAISAPTEMIASHISYGIRSFVAASDQPQTIHLRRAQIPLTEVIVSSF